MMCRASPRGVQTITTIRPRRNPAEINRNFAIVTPIIRDHDEIPGEDFRSIGKIKAAMLERCGPLCRIESDLHKNNRTPNNRP
jgi:hypothetical protein